MANKAVLELTITRKTTPPPYSFRECRKQLMTEFRNVYAKDIDTIMKLHNCHYIESHLALRLVTDKIKNQLQNAILPHTVKQFSCYRDTCGKVTCRNCSSDWKDHVGKACSMMESKDEASLRKEYEEKMTKAKVRTCTRCNTEFTKDGGCNTMTCRCGMTMCYICRKPQVSWNHFCTHGHGRDRCSKCKACPSYTYSQEDDELAIQELKQEASRKRKELGYAGERDIGVPAAKKAKKSRF